MSKKAIILVGLMLSTSAVQAAGVTKTQLFNIADSALGGYIATPPTGWARNFVFGPATPSSVAQASQQFFVLSPQIPATAYPTTVPTAAVVTRLSVSGTVLLPKDNLPVQVVSTDCTLPNYTNPMQPTYNACPSLGAGISMSTALPGRLVLTITKQTYNTTTRLSGITAWVYIFDPAATVASDRWTLVNSVSSTSSATGLANLFGNSSNASNPNVNFYVYNRPNATSTSVFQVVDK